MNIVKKAYQYLFYKLYKLCESMAYPWWSDTKAVSILDILLIITSFSLGFYYNIYIDRYVNVFPNKSVVVIICLIIIAFNHYLLSYKKKWKRIVKDFDQLPKKKNKIGSWLVVLFICFVLSNFIYSFYLLNQIDWSQYR